MCIGSAVLTCPQRHSLSAKHENSRWIMSPATPTQLLQARTQPRPPASTEIMFSGGCVPDKVRRGARGVAIVAAAPPLPVPLSNRTYQLPIPLYGQLNCSSTASSPPPLRLLSYRTYQPIDQPSHSASECNCQARGLGWACLLTGTGTVAFACCHQYWPYSFNVLLALPCFIATASQKAFRSFFSCSFIARSTMACALRTASSSSFRMAKSLASEVWRTLPF